MNTLDRSASGDEPRLLDAWVDSAVAIVKLSNVRKRNALSRSMLEALIAFCERCARDDVRVLVLTADISGGVWSSGHDIAELPRDGSDPLHPDSALERAIETLRTVPFPIVAQVCGSVWGGAVELVASCDIVVADDSARFAITPARIGLPYNLEGLGRFAERLALGAIRKMFFTAEPIDASEALRIGLVDELVCAAALEERAMHMARCIAGNAPLAIDAVKQQLRVLSEHRAIPQEVREQISEMRRRAYQGADFKEGVDAFVQKRHPVFGR